VSATGAADRRAGAAAEKAKTPAKAAAEAIFLNMVVPQYEFGFDTQIAQSPVDIHCKMFSTGAVKVWA
jgi:hypothetical protein